MRDKATDPATDPATDQPSGAAAAREPVPYGGRGPARTIAVILLSSGLVIVGNGMIQTLIPLRSELEGFSTTLIGIQGTAYFAGFIGGCVLGPRLIQWVGHIRAYAGITAMLAAMLLLFPVWTDGWFWAGLRFAGGICVATAFLVLESWLNDQATNENRGRVLSLYIIVTNAGWILGQLGVNLAELASIMLFVLVAVPVCLSVVPVALTPTREPEPVPDPRLDLPGLFHLSTVGTIGCLFVGIAEGAFWTLGPIYGAERGLTVFEVTMLMGAFILGGTISQWPIGKLSDRFDRRLVILPVVLATVCTGLALAMVGDIGFWFVFGLATLHGALMIPIYSLCIVHVNDNAPADRFVQVSGGLLLIYAAGAALGPLAAAPLMDLTGPGGVFFFISAVLAAFACVIAWRLRVAWRRDRAYRSAYSWQPRTTQQAYEIEAEDE